VADSEEKDSIEPTSSSASSTPDEAEDSSLAADGSVLASGDDDLGRLEDDVYAEKVAEDDAYALAADADDEPADDSAEVTAAARNGDEADESDGELVAVGAPTDRSVVKSRGTSRVEKKGRATPKQRPSARPGGRTNPVTFVKESVGELRKVVYPTGQQLANYFVVVLIFVLFIIAIVSVLDLAFGWAILKVFS
jgi:preprotein translocase subunit SecE